MADGGEGGRSRAGGNHSHRVIVGAVAVVGDLGYRW